MPANKESIVSAQVILRPASGKAIAGRSAISSSNLAEFAPPPGAVASAAAALRSKGFEIGPFVGISFSMTGSIRAFEEYLGTQIRLGGDRGYEFVIKNTSLGHELSGERLPEAIRHLVQTVAFPLPPDFGPTEFRG